MELFTNETEVQVNVLDRVPALGADRAGIARRDDANRIQRIPGQPQFVLSGEPLPDRSAWWNARSADAKGEWAVDLYAGVGLFSVKLAEAVRQGHGRGIEQQQLSRLGAQLRTDAA